MDDRIAQAPEVAMTADALDGWTVAPTALLEGLPDAVVASDGDGRIRFANRLAENLFGHRREQLVGRPVQLLWPERFHDVYSRRMAACFADPGRMQFAEAWGRRRDGTEFIGEMSYGVVTTSRGPLLLAIGRDVTARRATENRLRAVIALGEHALSGADATSLSAETVELIVGTLPVRGAEVRTADGAVLAATGTLVEGGIRVPIGTGDVLALALARELDDEELGLIRALANTLAIALERLREDERARWDAVHDPLTGLANRVLLRDRLRHALARAARGAGPAAVLFVDLDGFKQVNDQHGHGIGDEVLAALARRLAGAVRPGDTVARFGGDEFVGVCEEIDEAGALRVAERMLAAVQRPLVLGGVEHRLSASVGVALGSTDAERLLADADAAAYRAKANGRARVERY
jgi:diguanylate cyclase (GGDEF)-like protein/PAS domain S-box-containing protein